MTLLLSADHAARLVAQDGRAAAAQRLPQSAAALADDALTPEERVNVSVYENVNRSVVNINTKTVRNDNIFLLEVPSEGAGSGSVLDRRGHILTNYHVVNGAKEQQGSKQPVHSMCYQGPHDQ